MARLLRSSSKSFWLLLPGHQIPSYVNHPQVNRSNSHKDISGSAGENPVACRVEDVRNVLRIEAEEHGRKTVQRVVLVCYEAGKRGLRVFADHFDCVCGRFDDIWVAIVDQRQDQR